MSLPLEIILVKYKFVRKLKSKHFIIKNVIPGHGNHLGVTPGSQDQLLTLLAERKKLPELRILKIVVGDLGHDPIGDSDDLLKTGQILLCVKLWDLQHVKISSVVGLGTVGQIVVGFFCSSFAVIKIAFGQSLPLAV